MSEDVSATMRVGITVILVAALVATVLNLMVMSNSLLSGGQTTLQSGIDSVSQQEFAAYNNTKVSGTQVNTALSLFQGRDVAILIQTKTFKENYAVKASEANDTDTFVANPYMNYGALISSQQNKSSAPYGWSATGTGSVTAMANVTDGGYGGTPANVSQKFTLTESTGACASIAGSTAGNYYVVNVGDNATAYSTTNKTAAVSVTQKSGAPYLTALLYDRNGIVETNNNVIGCSTLGNPQFLLSSARFQSILIKDATGSIIGIAFTQIN